MKNTVRSIRGLAFASVASLGLIAMTPAMADSDFSTTPATGASADLNFEVVIPEFIRFQVGSAGTTVDLVRFEVPAADVGDGNPVSRTNDGGAAIPVTLVSNVGNLDITAVGSTGGPNDIDWTEITASSSDAAALPAPAVGGSASVSADANGVIDASADWTFVYDNSDVVAAGTYTGTVTYTAATP